jgi:hypothetical protein
MFGQANEGFSNVGGVFTSFADATLLRGGSRERSEELARSATTFQKLDLSATFEKYRRDTSVSPDSTRTQSGNEPDPA